MFSSIKQSPPIIPPPLLIFLTRIFAQGCLRPSTGRTCTSSMCRTVTGGRWARSTRLTPAKSSRSRCCMCTPARTTRSRCEPAHTTQLHTRAHSDICTPSIMKLFTEPQRCCKCTPQVSRSRYQRHFISHTRHTGNTNFKRSKLRKSASRETSTATRTQFTYVHVLCCLPHLCAPDFAQHHPLETVQRLREGAWLECQSAHAHRLSGRPRARRFRGHHRALL